MIYAPFTWSSRTTVTIGWVFYTRIIILTSETCPIQFNTYWFSTGLLHIFVQSSIVSRVREKSRLFYAIWLWSFVSEHVLNKSAKSKKRLKMLKTKTPSDKRNIISLHWNWTFQNQPTRRANFAMALRL